MGTITLRLPDSLQERLQGVAAVNHFSIDKQVALLLEKALQEAPITTIADNQTRYSALMAIVQKARSEPILDKRTDNEIMGYGDSGLPI